MLLALACVFGTEVSGFLLACSSGLLLAGSNELLAWSGILLGKSG